MQPQSWCQMVLAVLICDTSTISKLLLGPALQAIMCSSALLTSVLVSLSMAEHSMILWLVVEIMLITSLSLLLNSPMLLTYLVMSMARGILSRLLKETMHPTGYLLQVLVLVGMDNMTMNGLNPPLLNMIFSIGHMDHRFLDNIMPMVHSSPDNLSILVMLCNSVHLGHSFLDNLIYCGILLLILSSDNKFRVHGKQEVLHSDHSRLGRNCWLWARTFCTNKDLN